MSGVVSQIESVLKAGTEQLSARQTVTFTKYYRVVLPLDGYLFWVNAALISEGSIPNVAPFDTVTPNTPAVSGVPTTIQIEGSLHYDIERRQVDDQTYDVNRVIFTSESAISDFNEIGPGILWLGSYNNPLSDEGTIRFAFDKRKNFYQQANLYHYVGDAVYPDMETQIIDTLDGFDTRNVVVSNSLPIWLAMDPSNPPFPYPASQKIPLYPSFLVPDDATPPYAAVHIYPDETQCMTVAPYIDSATSSHYQLTRDKVKITFLGTRNFNAMDFVDYVNNLTMQYHADFGIMNIPSVRDEKRNQDEISAIAMKKSVIYEVTYNQMRMRDVAIAHIEKVIPHYIIGAV